jgi:hypothetical protein
MVTVHKLRPTLESVLFMDGWPTIRTLPPGRCPRIQGSPALTDRRCNIEPDQQKLSLKLRNTLQPRVAARDKLYDRRQDEISRDEVERILIECGLLELAFTWEGVP